MNGSLGNSPAKGACVVVMIALLIAAVLYGSTIVEKAMEANPDFWDKDEGIAQALQRLHKASLLEGGGVDAADVSAVERRLKGLLAENKELKRLVEAVKRAAAGTSESERVSRDEMYEDAISEAMKRLESKFNRTQDDKSDGKGAGRAPLPSLPSTNTARTPEPASTTPLTPAAPTRPAPLTCSSPESLRTRLKRAVKAAREKRKDIEDFWGVKPGAFGETMNPQLSPQYVEDKFMSALSSCGGIVYGVLGSSVTAGHDDFFNQSYPIVMERTMGQVFDQANVSLVVRNQAMGGMPAMPASLCVKTLVGDDVDVVLYEYDMMLAGTRGSVVELAVRNAISLPKQPAFVNVHSLDVPRNSGPKFPNGTCTLGKIGEYCIVPKQEGSLPPWRFDGNDEYCKMSEYYNSKGFYINALSDSRAFWGRDHDHPFTADDFQRNKPFSGAPWHPGPNGHRFRGETLAWNFLRMFEAAAERLLKGGMTRVFSANITVPPPMRCDPKICSKSPICLTTFRPQVGVNTTLAQLPRRHQGWNVVLSSGDREHVEHNEKGGAGYLDRKMVWESPQMRWEAVREGSNSRTPWLSMDLPEVVLQGTSWLSSNTHAHACARPYTARKNTQQGENEGMIVLCEPSTGWTYPDDMAPLSRFAEIRISRVGADADEKGWKKGVLIGNFTMAMEEVRSPVQLQLCNRVYIEGPKGLENVGPGRHSLHIRGDLNVSAAIRQDMEGRKKNFDQRSVSVVLSHVMIW